MDAMFEFLFWLFIAFMVRQAVIVSDMDDNKEGEGNSSSIKKSKSL